MMQWLRNMWASLAACQHEGDVTTTDRVKTWGYDTRIVAYSWQVMRGHLGCGGTHRFIAEAVQWLGEQANVTIEQEGMVWVIRSHPLPEVQDMRLDVALAECVADVAESLGIQREAFDELNGNDCWIDRPARQVSAQ